MHGIKLHSDVTFRCRLQSTVSNKEDLCLQLPWNNEETRHVGTYTHTHAHGSTHRGEERQIRWERRRKKEGKGEKKSGERRGGEATGRVGEKGMSNQGRDGTRGKNTPSVGLIYGSVTI